MTETRFYFHHINSVSIALFTIQLMHICMHTRMHPHLTSIVSNETFEN